MDKVTRLSTNHSLFEEKGEPKRNRTEVESARFRNLAEARWLIRDWDSGKGTKEWRLDRGYRPKKTGETVDRSQNNWSVKAVSSRHCPATCALRKCCFNCCAWTVTKTMSVALLLTNNLDNSKHSLPRRLLCFCSVHQGSAGRVAGSKLLSTPAYPLFCILQGGIGVFSPHNFFRVPFVSGAYTPRSLRSFSGGIRGRAFTLSSPSHSVPEGP